MKKLFILLVALTLVVCLFSACGGTGGGNNGDGSGSGNNGDGSGGGTADCQHTELVVNPKVPGVPSTCQQRGQSPEMLCADCGIVVQESERLPYGDHPADAIVKVDPVASTCTVAGRGAGTRCSLCTQMVDIPEVLELEPHTIVDTPYLEPTAVRDGHSGGKHCQVCATTIEAPEIISAHGHDVGLTHIEVKSTGAVPTCTTEGKRAEIYCSICEVTIQEATAIPALNHPKDFCVVPEGCEAVTATCTTTGLTAKVHCNLCDTDIQQQTEIPVDAGKHPADKWVVIEAVEPTCHSDGYYEGRKCSACGEIIYQDVNTNRPEHNYEIKTPYVAPDCATETNGSTALLECENEGCVYDEENNNNRTGGESIPYEHTMVEDPDSAVAPDCSVGGTDGNGREAGLKCSVEGCTHTEPGEIIYWEHTPGQWETIKEATATEKGEKQTTCTECGETYTEEIPLLVTDEGDAI